MSRTERTEPGAVRADARAASVHAVAEVIRDHLEVRAQAGETLEGASAWWLGSSRLDLRLASVDEALESLVARGTVARVVMATGQVLYRARSPAGGAPRVPTPPGAGAGTR